MSDTPELDAMIARLRDYPARIKRMAPKIAKECEAVARAELASGRGLGGATWKPTKEGKRALENAPDALTVVAVGTVLLFKFTGQKWYYRFHNDGGKKLPQREVLWSSGIPPKIKATIDRVVREELARD